MEQYKLYIVSASRSPPGLVLKQLQEFSDKKQLLEQLLKQLFEQLFEHLFENLKQL